ncbi:MAG: glutamyl-tRNA reductase [Taibaiella sp.]|nr:glutamyl-tRNA reductase [Taibaiella sp.]
MYVETTLGLANFWVVGINYRKADTGVRGVFAINNEQNQRILDTAVLYQVSELFILSTCNRTEIYGLCEHPAQLADLLCTQTQGSRELFVKQCYQKNANEAVLHLYNVAAGLDSQILGDYEIVGQLKEAVRLSSECEKLGVFLQRLFQSALQSSRDIRSKTKLSSGTVSVSYAAVQYAQNKSRNLALESILIVGSGKMGVAAIRNLLSYSRPEHITIINRTQSKAMRVARELGIQWKPLDQLEEELKAASLIIVATNAPIPVLAEKHFDKVSEKILIDLSVPNNIDPILGTYPNLHLANVDELSKINDQTLKMRMAEVPRVRNIINFHIHQFAEWYLMQKNVPYIRVMKEKLKELNESLRLSCPFDHKKGEKMQYLLNDMAAKMRHDSSAPGCIYIETMSGYLNPSFREAE